MPNQLITEISPYLLQHANNPVDWYPWGKEAHDKAIREDKPIFLSIGYMACHWCHVMEHESFTDEQVAKFLNEHFVSIKVDREERPDLDDLYMTSVVAMTGQGGWPMSVFLTPELHPFYGGTYFPPVPRYGIPAFLEVLAGIHQAWQTERDNVENIATQAIRHLGEVSAWGSRNDTELEKKYLEKAVSELVNHYDWQFGGWGKAPKFPQPMAVDFLLAQSKQDPKALEIACNALDAMQKGGMYDLVGGGFHRYSTDSSWLVPHFEKMLYDNAQLAKAYLHAYLITGNISYKRTTVETLDFILKEMTHSEGGFYSSLDADSDSEEGKYYVWSLDEFSPVMNNPDLVEVFTATYSLPSQGNFEGKIILQRLRTPEECASLLEISLEKYYRVLDKIHHKLFSMRTSKNRPITDDKILVSWNAYTMQAFAEAGFYLKRPDYLEAARKNAIFLLDNLIVDGQLVRTWRSGKAKVTAFLEDYAGLSIALLYLYQFDHELRWFKTAKLIISDMINRFQDTNGGFFDTDHQNSDLPGFLKNPQDNATPSGNAMAAHAILLLSALDSEHFDSQDTLEVLATIQKSASEYPTAFGYWLQVLSFAQAKSQQVALLYPNDKAPDLKTWLTILADNYQAHRIFVAAPYPLPPDAPQLLKNRTLLNNNVTAYICQNFICRQPTEDINLFQQQLAEETQKGFD